MLSICRKYYLDVKRLEDGFDLSDSNSPVLAHPPLKTVRIFILLGVLVFYNVFYFALLDHF